MKKISDIINPCDTYELKHKETEKTSQKPVWLYEKMLEEEKKKYKIVRVIRTSILG